MCGHECRGLQGAEGKPVGIVAYALGFPPGYAQWLKHIVLTQGDSLEDIRVSYAPVIKMEETA